MLHFDRLPKFLICESIISINFVQPLSDDLSKKIRKVHYAGAHKIMVSFSVNSMAHLLVASGTLTGGHVIWTLTSVEERISVVKFARSILVLGAYDPAPGERDRSLLDEHSEEIKRAKTISEIFNILCAYWNYLSYEILEYIIEHYGTSDDCERLKKYDEELCNFCKRRTFEFPPESGNDNMLNPRQKKFCVVLNVHEDIGAKEFVRIKSRIAKILKVNPAILTIQSEIGQLQTSEGQS